MCWQAGCALQTRGCITWEWLQLKCTVHRLCNSEKGTLERRLKKEGECIETGNVKGCETESRMARGLTFALDPWEGDILSVPQHSRRSSGELRNDGLELREGMPRGSTLVFPKAFFFIAGVSFSCRPYLERDSIEMLRGLITRQCLHLQRDGPECATIQIETHGSSYQHPHQTQACGKRQKESVIAIHQRCRVDMAGTKRLRGRRGQRGEVRVPGYNHL